MKYNNVVFLIIVIFYNAFLRLVALFYKVIVCVIFLKISARKLHDSALSTVDCQIKLKIDNAENAELWFICPAWPLRTYLTLSLFFCSF